MAPTDPNRPDPIKGFFAKARKALGWATADRREEARGELEEIEAAAPDSNEGPGDPEEALDDAELQVRADHGDLAPSAERQAERPPQQPPEGG